jgi:hypothetical protein
LANGNPAVYAQKQGLHGEQHEFPPLKDALKLHRCCIMISMLQRRSRWQPPRIFLQFVSQWNCLVRQCSSDYVSLNIERLNGKFKADKRYFRNLFTFEIGLQGDIPVLATIVDVIIPRFRLCFQIHYKIE